MGGGSAWAGTCNATLLPYACPRAYCASQVEGIEEAPGALEDPTMDPTDVDIADVAGLEEEALAAAADAALGEVDEADEGDASPNLAEEAS